MAIDLERVTGAAVDAFLRGSDPAPPRARDDAAHGRRRKRGGVRAMALGVGIGLAAGAVIRRVRDADLEQVAESIESRLER